MSDKYILHEDGTVEAADLMTWAKWFETSERHIGHDTIEGSNVRVSTVFLGLNHRFGAGAPVLFETMVFNGPLDGEQERYCTKAEAVAGHEAMLARVKAAMAEAVQL